MSFALGCIQRGDWRWLRSRRKAFTRKRALLWRWLYLVRYRLLLRNVRHGAVVATIVLFFLIGFTAFLIPALQDTLEPLFATEQNLDRLRTVFLTIGGALLGASAFVSSLVLFAMQVNIERMPHGLFRRLSADNRLLSAFAATFLLPLFLVGLAFLPDGSWIGAAAFGAAWAILLVLILYLYAYRRALVLVNPLYQLEMVVTRTRQQFRAWVRRANRAAPLLSDQDASPHERDDPFASTHDVARVVYFQANPHWTDGSKQAVRYAVSFARRFAEQGDHEVSAAALNMIIAINAAYVEAKGKTFFADHFMSDNPLTSDGFINDTLEHLRQCARVGVSRGDEQQIEQALRAFAGLVRVYATIDYSSLSTSKTHAHLAAAYLSNEVERIVPHGFPDVLMEGMRLMGQCAELLLFAEGPDGIRSLVEKIGIVGCCGIAKDEYQPVTLTSVEQLARLSFNLLRTRSRDIQFTAAEIRSKVSLLTKLFLAVPEKFPSLTHYTFLSPYYSGSSEEALAGRLAKLANALLDAKADDKNAQQCIANFEQWADGLYRTEKELLLEAIKRRSQFTFDIIHWTSQVTTILLVVSNSPACNEYNRKKLRKHALWLISVLSFIPDDIETVKFVESFRITETLFDAALEAHRHKCPDIADDIAGLLILWMFDGGKYQSGWPILERSMYGLAVFALVTQTESVVIKLKAEVRKRIAAGEFPDQDVRDQAAQEIRSRAASLYDEGHWSSSIERHMARVDHEKLKPLLEEFAELISPETIGQVVDQEFL